MSDVAITGIQVMASRELALQDRVHSVGEEVSGVMDIPDTATKIGIALQRKAWANLGSDDVVHAFVEISENGTDWLAIGGVSASAVSKVDRQGNPLTETTSLVRLPRNRPKGMLARVRTEYMGQCEGATEIIFDDSPVPEFVEQLHNSVTYDTDAESSGTNATSLTFAITVGNNANRAMVVGVGTWDSTAGDAAVSTVTFNSDSLSLINEEQGPDSAGSNNRVTQMGMAAPDVATANVVVTFGGTCAEFAANALSVHDAAQSSTFGTPADAEVQNQASITVNVGSATDDMVVDVVFGNTESDLAFAAGANQTQRSSINIVNNSWFATSTEPGGTTITMSYTANGSDIDEGVISAVSIKVAAAGSATAPTRVSPLHIMGMG